MGEAFFEDDDEDSMNAYHRALSGEEALQTDWRGVEEWIDARLPGVEGAEALLPAVEE